MKKLTVMLLAGILAISLTACGQSTNNSSSQTAEENNTAAADENENTADDDADTYGDEAADAETENNSDSNDSLSKDSAEAAAIEEAIRNNMLFSCVDSGGSKELDADRYTLYADGTVLYASLDASGRLSTYAQLVSDGQATAEIQELRITAYDNKGIFLDANGKVWYGDDEMFPGYTVTYFNDWYRFNSSYYNHIIAGVTDDGQIVYFGEFWTEYNDDPEIPILEGAENVKYVTVFGGKTLAFVREDGTAAYGNIRTGKITEISDWSGIAMLYVVGNTLIGLRYDGTLVARAISESESEPVRADDIPYYLEEISSWEDIVWIVTDKDNDIDEENYVAGLRSDGSFVYVAADASEAAECEQTFGSWTNIKVVSTDSGYISAEENRLEDGYIGMGGAIDTDNNLYGSARALTYAWDLEQPWESTDAAKLDSQQLESAYANCNRYNEQLPSVN